LLSPISSLHFAWLHFRNNNLYKLTHTGQVCYLRKSLNDSFDVSNRRIYIASGNQYKRDYIYTKAAQKPRFLGVMYLHSRYDFADKGVDFIVYVPTEIVTDKIHELKAHINYYKEGVKRYKIERI
jgi:hypothetical protein